MRLLVGSALKRGLGIFVAHVGVAAVLIGVAGCVAAPAPRPITPMPESAWGGRYDFHYEIPAGATAPAVPVTVAVVTPAFPHDWREEESSYYQAVTKGFHASMGTDLEKILIAKSMTCTGPFPSRNEMTYAQKKGATLTLAPEILLKVVVKDVNPARPVGQTMAMGEAARQDQDFTMSVTGWITFIMEEPLSGEKMWIKKLELGPVDVQGVVVTQMTPVVSTNPGDGLLVGPYSYVSGYTAGKIMFDGRPDALADAMKQLYPVIMTQFQKYIDSEELVQLKKQCEEIRTGKRY